MARQKPDTEPVPKPSAREQRRDMRDGVMPVRTWRERFDALRNVRPFLGPIWGTSRSLTVATLLLRLIRSVLPVLTLYIGKLIIDEVIRLAAIPNGPSGWQGWRDSGLLDQVGWLVAAEFGLAIFSDILARIVGLVDNLLTSKCAIATSVRIMEHAATLDLEDFEDSDWYPRLSAKRTSML